MDNIDWEIAWNDFLTVGVPAMDEDHRKFISRVNDLSKAIIEAEDKVTVRRAMELMLIEAAAHFRSEQELLAEWNYPETAAHTAKHAQLAQQLERMMQEFDQADISFVWAVKGLQVKKLLVEHLLTEDLKYQDFLQARQGPR